MYSNLTKKNLKDHWSIDGGSLVKPIEQWLSEYGESHQNRTNKKIHYVAVPVIMMTLLGLLWAIPKPAFFPDHFLANWSTLFVSISLVFYASLHFCACILMLLMSALMLSGIYALDQNPHISLVTTCVAFFIVAWIFQFIGHKIEGKKPSFFEDLVFLLIGPLWIFKGIIPCLFEGEEK
jgi:uncharacterized membrane protein YGL010W